MTLKVRILQSLTRLFIILVSLMMSLFSEKMPIFNRCVSGSMSNLIEKSWKVSNIYNVNNNVIKAKLIQKILSTSLWNIGLLYLLRSLNTCNRTSFLEPLKVKKSQKQI